MCVKLSQNKQDMEIKKNVDLAQKNVILEIYNMAGIFIQMPRTKA